MNVSERPRTLAPSAGIASWVVIAALGMLLGLQPITTDLYLPALPQLQRELRLTPSSAQWTLSVLILAFGMGQIAWGAVSDRFGRRPVLLGGLALYVLASIAATVAGDLSVMIAARAAQGASLSAAVVCGRAMVRDLYAPEHGVRVMAKGMTGLGIVALIGPIAGGLTATYGGWRATLSIMGLCGAVVLWFVWRSLPETLPDHRRQASLHWPTMAADWMRIARHPMFRAHALLVSATYGGLYAYLALSSFAFIDVLGVPRTAYGAIMATVSVAYLAGTVQCRRWLNRFGLRGAVRIAGACSFMGGLMLVIVSAGHEVFGLPTPVWSLLPGLWLYAFAHASHQACGQTGVVASFPRHAGAASALSGLIMSVIAFVIGLILSIWSAQPGWAGTIHPFTLAMGIGGAMTAWVAWGRVQRDGDVEHGA